MKAAILLGCFALPACTKQMRLTEWSSTVPTTSPALYSPNVTTGDILQIRFYIDAKLQEQSYQLGVGDVVRVDLYGFPELARERVTILPDGSISLPLIGNVHIEKATTEEANQLITDAYVSKGLKDPVVVVSVVEGQQRLRHLLDARRVDAEGDGMQIPIYEGMPISLPLIGSINVDRPLKDIQQEINQKYNQEFGSQLNVVVNIRQRENPTITVLGEVKTPGKVPMTRPLTPIEAIAAAGGYTETADLERVAVIRLAQDQQPYQRWLFNLEDDMNNPDSPHHRFTLGKGDVVLVIKTDVADMNLWVAQYLRNNLPIQSYIGATLPIGP